MRHYMGNSLLNHLFYRYYITKTCLKRRSDVEGRTMIMREIEGYQYFLKMMENKTIL